MRLGAGKSVSNFGLQRGLGLLATLAGQASFNLKARPGPFIARMISNILIAVNIIYIVHN